MSRSAQIQTVFFAALNCAPPLRREFVALTCVDDPPMVVEVEELLAAESEAVGALDRCFWTSEDRATRSVERLLEGRGRIGPYRILRQLFADFRGGVYEAARADDPGGALFRVRTVDMRRAHQDSLDRLRRERDVLTRLQHPALPALVESGTTNDGAFFLATELPQGESMLLFAERLKLPVPRRVELLRPIVAALAAAHQERVYDWVIDADSIRVTPDGRPWLTGLDIAGYFPGAPHEVHTGSELGAQLVARNLGDLGVFAYELLTGVQPAIPRGAPVANARRVRLARPSEANPAARAELRGALDRICLRLLSPRRDQRYVSARALLADLDAYLRRHVEGSDAEAEESTLRRFLSGRRGMLMSAALGGLLVAAPLAEVSQRLRETQRRARQARALNIEMIHQIRDLARSRRSGRASAEENFLRQAMAYLESATLSSGGDREMQGELAQALLDLQAWRAAPEAAAPPAAAPAAPPVAMARVEPSRAARAGTPAVRPAVRRKSTGVTHGRRFVDRSGVVFNLEDRDWSAALNRKGGH